MTTRDPAEERALEQEEVLLDVVEVLSGFTRDPKNGNLLELVRLKNAALELLDKIDDERHERGLCAGTDECGHCWAAKHEES